jgi:CheY-like chemotaxis protein
VDDEESIVLTAKALLVRLGHSVVATTCPLRALGIIESGEHRFDLVISDLTMPKMTGVELSKKLLKLKSGIPVILCTGFSAAISQEKLLNAGIREVIMKPIISSELAKTIESVLEVKEGDEARV